MCQEKLVQLVNGTAMELTVEQTDPSVHPSQHSDPEMTLMCLVAKCVAAAASLFLCLELDDGCGTPGSRGLYLAL